MDRYLILSTGNLLYVTIQKIVSQEEYCVDATSDDNSYIHAVFICGELEENDSESIILHYIYVIGKLTLLINCYIVMIMYFWFRSKQLLSTKHIMFKGNLRDEHSFYSRWTNESILLWLFIFINFLCQYRNRYTAAPRYNLLKNRNCSSRLLSNHHLLAY